MCLASPQKLEIFHLQAVPAGMMDMEEVTYISILNMKENRLPGN